MTAIVAPDLSNTDPRIELILTRAVPLQDAEHPHLVWRRLKNGTDMCVGYLSPQDLEDMKRVLIRRLRF